MNQRFSLIMMICFMTLSSFSQFTIQWGEEQVGKSLGTGVLGSDEDGYYLQTVEDAPGLFGNFIHQLFVVDKELNVRVSKEFKIPKEEERKSEGVSYIGDRLISFSTKSTDNVKSFYWQEISKSTLTLNNDAKKILSIPLGEKGSRGEFLRLYTDDRSNVLILGLHGDNSMTLSMVMLNSNMEELWRVEGKEMPSSVKDSFFVSADLDNDGNLYIQCASKRTGKMSMEEGNLEYRVHVLQLKDECKTIIDQEFIVQDVYLSSLTFRQFGDKLKLIGLYSSKSYDNPEGIITLSVDKEGSEMVLENKQPFEKEMLEQFMTERQQKRKGKMEEKGKSLEPWKFEIEDIVFFDDGSYAVVLEQSYSYQRVIQSRDSKTGLTTSTRTINVYMYNDILVSRFSKDDSYLWTKLIHKNQRSQDDDGATLGFAIFRDGSDLYFFYNDHPKNLEEKDPLKWFGYFPVARTSVVVQVKIGLNGDLIKEKLFSTKESGMVAVPKNFAQLSKNTMLVNLKKKRKYKFGILMKE